MKKIKEIITSLLVSCMLVVPVFAVVGVASAQPSIEEGLDQGTCLSTNVTECGEDPDTKINTIIETIINIFSLVVGVVSVIMIIIGGFKYITSGGEPGSVGGAKNTILFAIVGLVIVALAQVIVRFVLNRVTDS
jgi:hypothetical protein